MSDEMNALKARIAQLEEGLAKLLDEAKYLDSRVTAEYGGKDEDFSAYKALLPDYAEYEKYVNEWYKKDEGKPYDPGVKPLDYTAWRGVQG